MREKGEIERSLLNSHLFTSSEPVEGWTEPTYAKLHRASEFITTVARRPSRALPWFPTDANRCHTLRVLAHSYSLRTERATQ